MVSSPGDRTGAESSDLNGSPTVPNVASSKSRADLTAQMDMELMFRLIDSILPFEACLYHQILPLSLEGSRLKLGMVNLDDSAALDYVRRILAYMNCSLAPQTLSSEVHHAVLSAYLNYAGTQKKTPSTRANSQSVAKRIEQKLSQSTTKRITNQPTENQAPPPASETASNPAPTVAEPLSTKGAIAPQSIEDRHAESSSPRQPQSLPGDH